MSIPNRFDIVEAIDMAYPQLIATNSRETVTDFLWRTVSALADSDPHWGFLSKLLAENHIEIPGAGRVSIDAIAYQGEHNVVDIIRSAGDGPGTGGLAWGETHERRESSVWVAAVPYPGSTAPPVQPPVTPPVVTPPAPPAEPPPDYTELLRAVLEGLALIEAEVKTIGQDVSEIKAMPLPAFPDYTGSFRVLGQSVTFTLRPAK